MPGDFSSGSGSVHRTEGRLSAFGLTFSAHVQNHSMPDGRLRSHSIDGLLHLAIATIASLNCVGGGRQQGIVQEAQGLLERGAEKFAQAPTKVRGLPNLLP
jgi:hypothetical protein